MSAQDEAGPPEAPKPTLRWLGRLVVAAIGLWFIADGLRGMWSGAGTVAQVLIVVAGVLVAAFAVVGVLYLAKRGREG